MKEPEMTRAAPSVAVVIPVYQPTLSAYERVAFRQCLRVLGAYPILLVKPQSLDLDAWLDEHPNLATVSFDDSYFSSVVGYNRLLMSEGFYQAFAAYQFILIHQLDAFVFRDELPAWCAQGYDYVGAPHIRWRNPQRPTARLARFGLRKVLMNGGLSLRNVEACRRFLWVFRRFYGTWKGNEDGLFSLHYPRLYFGLGLLNLPTWNQALPFAFEKDPQFCYDLTQYHLPMGCHAWERYDPDFWRPFFREAGYEI